MSGLIRAQGYFLTDPERPDVIRGQQMLNAFPMGTYKDKCVTFVLFNLGDPSSDEKGEFASFADMSLIDADEVAQNPLWRKLAKGESVSVDDLKSFAAPSAIAKVVACLKRGMSQYDAVMYNLAFLIPEFCGETFQECVDRGFYTESEYVDPITLNKFTLPNLYKCSQDIL